MKTKILASWISIGLLIFMAGCVLPPRTPPSPPPTPKFVFTPPSSVPATRSNMAIAIIKPLPSGSFLIEDTNPQGVSMGNPGTTRVRMYVDEMLKAAQTDIDKILIAKGFTTVGVYPAIDEMTFSEKERSTLILLPRIEVDWELARSQGSLFSVDQTATVRGNVVLEFLEPLSREKVWLKRLELTPFTKTVRTERSRQYDPNDPYGYRQHNTVGQAAMIEILNEFYPAAMKKIWDHLDAKEIQLLRKDADKLKGRTGYTGKTSR
jgi:hypothetical protein